MGVILLNKPRELSFTGNPLAFTLKGDNYITIPGIKSILTLQHISGLVYGHSFNISFLGYNLTFDVVSIVPDDSGLQIAVGSTTQEIIDQLNKNFYLSEYFNITISGADIIEIQAKETGSDYNISCDFALCPGLTVLSNEQGMTAVFPNNYKIFLQLLIESKYNSGIYEEAVQMYLDVDESGRTPVRLEDIIKYLFPYTNLPALSDKGISLCMHTVKRYSINVAESYGNPVQMQKLISSGIYYVLNGQLPVNLFPGTGFHHYVITNKNFLYTGPSTRETWENAREYLYFFNPIAGTTNDLHLKVKIFYTDGTEDDQTLDIYDIALRNQVFMIPVGYERLDLASINPSKTIYRYQVSINLIKPPDSDFEVASPITFNLISKPRFAREFLFQNRYGVYETLLATGKQKNDFSTKRLELKKELPDDYNLQDGEIKSQLENKEDVFTCSTGFKTLKAIDDLKQCLVSENFFLLHNEKYVRCRVIAGSFKIYNENDDLYFLEFKYSFAFEDTPIDEPGTTTNMNYYSHDYSDSYKH
ncbi:MAG: hypothetical protein K8S00_12155 [Bacteroidales bacterium]|nr:hypothetical protein [Bacteroidales bacterium]